MFLGEKEKKQLNIPTIAVSQRVRETRVQAGEAPAGDMGMGLHTAA